MDRTSVDGLLVQWGDRLFYPGNRIVKTVPGSSLTARLVRQRANAIRARIEATVVGRAPQVMVKVTGGGRGIKAIAAHFRYISKSGRLDIEDDRGEILKGKSDLHNLIDDWRLGGTPILDVGFRREAVNIMLSMPRGVDALCVLKAARQFAQREFSDHKYVMVLHDHQANPHVHLSVRAESRLGRRLAPRKPDLRRWRDLFAENLRAFGLEAESSSRRVRASATPTKQLWRIKAEQDGRLHESGMGHPSNQTARPDTTVVPEWLALSEALSRSAGAGDRGLARKMQLHSHPRLAAEKLSESPKRG